MRDGTGDGRRDEHAHSFLADAERVFDGYQEECGEVDDGDWGDEDGAGDCGVTRCAQQ